MDKKSGKKIFNGIAIGKIRFYAKAENQVSRTKVEDVNAEITRYEDAKQTATGQLEKLYEKALVEVGEANAEIFNVHIMMLEDDDFNESVHNIITSQKVNAEYAVASTGDNFAEMFANMEDEYFKARSADIKDITERVLTILCGNGQGGDIGEEPVIIVAEDLAPARRFRWTRINYWPLSHDLEHPILTRQFLQEPWGSLLSRELRLIRHGMEKSELWMVMKVFSW